MKKIVFHASSFDGFWAHYLFFNDQDFINRLNSSGYEFFHSDKTNLIDADVIIFSEATSVGLYRFGLLRRIKHILKLLLGRIPPDSVDFYKKCQEYHFFEKTILIVGEGKIHLPENHDKKLAKLFPAVLTWNDTMIDGKSFFKCRIPQPLQWPKIENVPYQNKKLLVNISANKYHSNPLELYSSRRSSIKFFEKSFPDQFDLYGIGWNEPATLSQRIFKNTYPFFNSYKGIIKSKTEVYPKYRFALIYENAQVPGYVTEKIFDCLRCNCVPIYLGAPNITEYIPEQAFIDRRQFPNDAELGKFLVNIDEKKYNEYLSSIDDYLSSTLFFDFLSTSLADNIVDLIEGKYKKVK